MMLLVLKFLLVSIVICALGKGSDEFQMVQPIENRIGPEALLLRLDKLLDMCIANYEDLSTDLLLGVAIANGQVKSILAFTNLDNRLFTETLQKKCDYVESRIDSIFSFPSGANAIVSKLLINSNFWQDYDEKEDIALDISGQSLRGNIDPLPSDRRQMHGRHILRDYLSSIDVGEPSELQSADQCLSELLVNDSENEFNSTLSRAEQPMKPLFLSQGCSAAMSVRRKAYGYHLTHKLLFYLILGKQQFTNVEQDFVMLAKERLCNQILRESRLIVELGYPEMFRDLFMEQVFLCAYVGYAEFRNQTWLNEIVRWQNANGCFKYYHDSDVLKVNVLTTACSTHMTGVGAAVFGLFAKIQLVG